MFTSYFVDTTGDEHYDSEIKAIYMGGGLGYQFVRVSGGASVSLGTKKYPGKSDDELTTLINDQIAEFAITGPYHHYGSVAYGATESGEWSEEHASSDPRDTSDLVGDRDDIGLPSITEESWMGMTLDQQAQYLLDTKYGGDVPNQENDIEYLKRLLKNQPLKGNIDETKAGFLAEQYGSNVTQEQIDIYDFNKDGVVTPADLELAKSQGYHIAGGGLSKMEALYGKSAGVSFADSLAGRTAGQALSTSLTGLQGEAEGVGGVMQGAYASGMGSSIRGAITGQKKIAKGFGAAEDVYDLAKTTAGLDYEKGMYGLEGDVTADWESDWKTFYGNLPDATGG